MYILLIATGAIPVTITGETVQIGESCEGPADPNKPSYKDTIVRTVIVEVFSFLINNIKS